MWKDSVKADARKAQEIDIDTVRDILRGASGKVPQWDLLRIWDTGASQGMTDRSMVSSDASVKGKRITIYTGNGSVSSDMCCGVPWPCPNACRIAIYCQHCFNWQPER